MPNAATRTRQERTGHLSDLEGAIIDGTEPGEAVAKHATKFGLTLVRARKDFRLVRNKWLRLGKRASGRADEELGRAVSRATRLVCTAIISGDVAAAVEAEKHLTSLLGITGGRSEVAARPLGDGESLRETRVGGGRAATGGAT